MLAIVIDGGVEPCLGELPVARNGYYRNLENLGRFFHAQTAEVLHLDDPAFALVKSFKSGQGCIQLEKIIRAPFDESHCFIQRNSLRAASAFGPIVTLRMIDEYAAHHLSRYSDEVRAVLPLDLFLID